MKALRSMADLRAWFENQRDMAQKSPGDPRVINPIIEVQTSAINVIDTTRKAHRGIVALLMERLAKKQAALDIAHQTLHDQTVQHYNVLESMEAGQIALLDELNAEKSCTNALNERLAEYEAREVARAADSATVGEQAPEQASAVLLFLHAVREENERAKLKHPGTEAMGNALSEETGEVMMALADEPPENVYKECVQVASTAMRIALEGDRAVDFVRARRGLAPLPGSPFAGPEWNGEGEINTPHDLRAAISAAMFRHLVGQGIEQVYVPHTKLTEILAGVATAEFGRWLAQHPVQKDLPGI